MLELVFADLLLNHFVLFRIEVELWGLNWFVNELLELLSLAVVEDGSLVYVVDCQ